MVFYKMAEGPSKKLESFEFYVVRDHASGYDVHRFTFKTDVTQQGPEWHPHALDSIERREVKNLMGSMGYTGLDWLARGVPTGWLKFMGLTRTQKPKHCDEGEQTLLHPEAHISPDNDNETLVH
jgi:hypothetical protein